jgi:uncharacterized protein YjbI with pentapeptide repeats
VDLSGVPLNGAGLSFANLSGANLSQANLSKANLSGANLSGTNLSRTNLSGTDLSGTDLSGAINRSRNLSGTNLSGTNLSGANLNEANPNEAKLDGAELLGSDLSVANLSVANLIRANLSKANLSGANLEYANLFGANLRGAELIGGDLSSTKLSLASLFGSFLNGARFYSAKVGSTVFADVDLSTCKGLGSVRHEGPSTLGVDTIMRSKGRIPDVLLRGVGLPDDGSTIFRRRSAMASSSTLVSSATAAWTSHLLFGCMTPFRQKGYDAGWMKGNFYPAMTYQESWSVEFIWDKFLLCASKNSLTSWWVEDEIKTTLEKEKTLEKERGKPVRKLIPLNLDGYILTEEWDFGVLRQRIKSRVAADFRDWEKPHSDFDKQVDRVIKALRADEGARETPPSFRL